MRDQLAIQVLNDQPTPCSDLYFLSLLVLDDLLDVSMNLSLEDVKIVNLLVDKLYK